MQVPALTSRCDHCPLVGRKTVQPFLQHYPYLWKITEISVDSYSHTYQSVSIKDEVPARRRAVHREREREREREIEMVSVLKPSLTCL